MKVKTKRKYNDKMSERDMPAAMATARAWAEAHDHVLKERAKSFSCVVCEASSSIHRDNGINFMSGALGDDAMCGESRLLAHAPSANDLIADRKFTPSRAVIAYEQRSFLDLIHFSPNPLTTCWACRDYCFDGERVSLEKAHIVPHYLGGTSAPWNFFLLCGSCHLEHPDSTNIAASIFWLVSRERGSDRTLRRAREMASAAVRFGIQEHEVADMLARFRT